VEDQIFFDKIKRFYLKLTDSKNSLEDRFTNARRIVDNVRSYYKNQEAIKIQFNKINNERKLINARRKKKNPHAQMEWIHQNDVRGWMGFLIEGNYIPEILREEFNYISRTSNPYAHGVSGNDASIERIVSSCNEILTWFFSKHRVDGSFLEPKRKNVFNDRRIITGLVILIVITIVSGFFGKDKLSFFYPPASTEVEPTFVDQDSIEKPSKNKEHPLMTDTEVIDGIAEPINDKDTSNFNRTCCDDSKDKIELILFELKYSSNTISENFLDKSLKELKIVRSSCELNSCDIIKLLRNLDEELRYFAQNLVEQNPASSEIKNLSNRKLLSTYKFLSYLCEEINCSDDAKIALQKLQKLYTE